MCPKWNLTLTKPVSVSLLWHSETLPLYQLLHMAVTLQIWPEGMNSLPITQAEFWDSPLTWSLELTTSNLLPSHVSSMSGGSYSFLHLHHYLDIAVGSLFFISPCLSLTIFLNIFQLNWLVLTQKPNDGGGDDECYLLNTSYGTTFLSSYMHHLNLWGRYHNYPYL